MQNIKNNTLEKTRYSAFLGDSGHGSDECMELKAEMENLIKRGYYRKFVAERSCSRHTGRARITGKTLMARSKSYHAHIQWQGS